MKLAEKYARDAYGYVVDHQASFEKRIKALSDFFDLALQEQIEGMRSTINNFEEIDQGLVQAIEFGATKVDLHDIRLLLKKLIQPLAKAIRDQKGE